MRQREGGREMKKMENWKERGIKREGSRGKEISTELMMYLYSVFWKRRKAGGQRIAYRTGFIVLHFFRLAEARTR